MTELAQFAFDCLTMIEILASENQGLSRHKIRHALSMLAPLGTNSAEIDLQWSVVCETLNKTDLVIEQDGVFFWKHVNRVVDDATLN